MEDIVISFPNTWLLIDLILVPMKRIKSLGCMWTFTYIPHSISVLRWLNTEEGLQVVLQVVISRLPKKRLFWDMKSVFVHKYMYIKSLNAMGDSKLCVSKSFPKCYSWLACHWSYNGFILIHQFYITTSIYI